MDERVFVSIKGLHFASGVQDSDSDGSEDEEVIETVNTGRYKRSGENEYIKYSDMIDGEDKPCSNLIKITPDGTVEITKKGYVTKKQYTNPDGTTNWNAMALDGLKELEKLANTGTL